jgi:hypothetical protein
MPKRMSAEEAIADILACDDAPIAVYEAPDFLEELVKRGYKVVPIDEKEQSR